MTPTVPEQPYTVISPPPKFSTSIPTSLHASILSSPSIVNPQSGVLEDFIANVLLFTADPVTLNPPLTEKDAQASISKQPPIVRPQPPLESGPPGEGTVTVFPLLSVLVTFS
jgi:hypothetical protein